LLSLLSTYCSSESPACHNHLFLVLPMSTLSHPPVRSPHPLFPDHGAPSSFPFSNHISRRTLYDFLAGFFIPFTCTSTPLPPPHVSLSPLVRHPRGAYCFNFVFFFSPNAPRIPFYNSFFATKSTLHFSSCSRASVREPPWTDLTFDDSFSGITVGRLPFLYDLSTLLSPFAIGHVLSVFSTFFLLPMFFPTPSDDRPLFSADSMKR